MLFAFRIMGIVSIMFAELWVKIFQTCVYYYYHYYYYYYYYYCYKKTQQVCSSLIWFTAAVQMFLLVNLSMSSLGIFGNSCNSFFKMCDSFSIDQQQKQYLISKLSNIAIRTTYYIFCCKNKPWTNPELHPV